MLSGTKAPPLPECGAVQQTAAIYAAMSWASCTGRHHTGRICRPGQCRSVHRDRRHSCPLSLSSWEAPSVHISAAWLVFHISDQAWHQFSHSCTLHKKTYKMEHTPWLPVRKQTIPTGPPSRPAKLLQMFWGQRVLRGQRNRSSRPLIPVF
jgi:hypothetical protein